MKFLPKILSNIEAEWWGLPTMLPDFPPEEILFIESKWSKKNLQRMARENFLDPGGDKELLISKLMYVGALDNQGEVVEKPAEKRAEEFAEALPSTVKKKGATPGPEYPRIPEARVKELKRREDIVRQVIKDKPDITLPELEQATQLELVQIDGAIRRLGEKIVIKTDGKMTPGGLTPSSYRLTPEGLAIPQAEALPSTVKKKFPERMPRINPHASAIKQDEQLREQMKWLKKHGFKTAREAQEAGY